MADDDDDRQPPQSYDTVSPAGVGAASGNQMSPRAWQDLYFTGDQGLLDVAMEEMEAEPLFQFMESLPITGRDGAPPAQASSPAGVGSRASHSPPFQSPQTTPESPRSPPGWRTAPSGRTAAGAGGNGCGGGGGGRGGRGGGRGGAGGGAGGRGAGGAGGAGGRGGGGAGGGAGGGGAGGAGGGGGGGRGGGGGGGGGRRGRRGGRRGRRRRLFPGSPLTPASNPASLRGSWTSGSPPPRTLRQADLQRRLRMLLQDQEQLAQGREIANVTMTNSIVTSYKQGGAPSVQTSSSRVSP